MNFTLISKEKNTAKFTMTFTGEEFDKAVNAVYQANKAKYPVDGFRKGKAPRSRIEAVYGHGIFFEDAIDNMLNEAYPAALSELDLAPVDRPDIAFGDEPFEKGKGFEATVTVTVAPEVEVKDYKGVQIEKVEHPVTEEDVQKELEAVQKRNARMVVVEREAQDGDTVILDYAGFCGEEQFEGGTAERQSLKLGSKTFIPGFEEQLVGAAAGADVDVKVTFPEEYHAPDLAGKEAVFKCHIHEVKTEELPELNDDFAMDVSDFDTLDEYKADIKAKLEKSAEESAKFEMQNAVLTKICDATEIEIPEIMFEDEAEAMLNDFAMQLQQSGMSLEMYTQYLGKDKAALKEELRPDAEKRVKTRLVLDAIAKAENVEVGQEEIDAEVQAIADMYKMDVEQVRGMLNLEIYSSMMGDIRTRKVLAMLVETADVQ
ncbi:MAG: trigger factor [Firmicutes bacterium]|nr:trigger factor [Bacillota bacterium]MBR4074402.1 trigger factor [Bacillota bacterium]MBR7148556.1 trigger factor [Bacillota bacterium]